MQVLAALSEQDTVQQRYASPPSARLIPDGLRLYYEVGTAVFTDLLGPESPVMTSFEPEDQVAVIYPAIGVHCGPCSSWLTGGYSCAW